MRTHLIRSLSLTALTLVALAGHGIAQSNPSALLTAPEIQRLIASGTPADHARLSVHFTALAAQDDYEAKRHAALEQSYRSGSPKIGAVAMSSHCKRLAELSLASAATSREMATEHGKLAAGAAPTPMPMPRDRASTAGERTPTDKELTDLAARATTAKDHRALEQYFTTLATRYDSEATNHVAYAKSWRSTAKASNAATIASHCDKIAEQRREAAKEARASASMHKTEAGTAK